LRRVAAALFAVLLPFVVPQEGVSAAQNNGALVRTITNIAEATWDAEGSRRRVSSNPVRFDVSATPPPPPAIRVFRRSPGGGTELVYRPPSCSITPGPVQQASRLAVVGSQGTSSTAAISTALVQPTDQLRGGEPLYFEVTANAANRDPAAIDSLTVVLTTVEGDRETMTVFETAPDSGVFAGVIDTLRTPPPLEVEDCRLSVGADSRITVAAMNPATGDVLVEAAVEVLVDPFGVVFDGLPPLFPVNQSPMALEWWCRWGRANSGSR
jgi:hypothetical protein